MSKRKKSSSNNATSIGFKYQDQIPTPAACLSSLGTFENGITPLEYITNGQFDPLRVPMHEDDWLAQHEPDNQTFDKWLERFITYKETLSSKKTIYLLPIGKKEHVATLPSLRLLIEFCTAFFIGLEIKTMDPLYIDNKDDTSQIKVKLEGKRARIYPLESRHSHPYDKHKMIKQHKQYSVHPLMDLCGTVAPSDARCIVGVTMEDLYSDTTDSFTVGMASGPLTGVAIFSFARYDPLFSIKYTKQAEPNKRRKGNKKATDGKKEDGSDKQQNGSNKKEDADNKKEESGNNDIGEDERVLLERSCKVLAHEIGHMLGIAHCTYYECLMNGSGHLEEDFRQPLHLCPTDLRKLVTVLEADVLERYQSLLAFYEKVRFEGEAVWMRQRIKFLGDHGASKS